MLGRLAQFGKALGAQWGVAAVQPVPRSGSVAKERLALILTHQRAAGKLDVLAGVDMKGLQHELLECVKRHIQQADNSSIQISVRTDGDLEIFEARVPLTIPGPGQDR